MGKDDKAEREIVDEKLSQAVMEAYRKEGGAAAHASFPGGDVKPFAYEFRVFFERKVYDDIQEHAHLDDSVELGGVLVGDLKKDDCGAYLHIIASIRGKHASSTLSQVTFTQETWNHINEVKDRDYAGHRIVGWYHTHPKFGIFLSEMDLFIHENFFGHPYQVAVVIDPVDRKEGCFMKGREKIQLLKRFWVEKEEHRCVEDRTEKERILERLEALEKKLDELVCRPAAGEPGGKGSSLAAMAGWMVAFLVLIFFLLLGGGRRWETLPIENPVRNNEVLITTEDDDSRGVQLRLYAAPLVREKSILLRHAEKGNLEELLKTGEEQPTVPPSPAHSLIPSPAIPSHAPLHGNKSKGE